MPGNRQSLSISFIASVLTVTAYLVQACPYCPPTDATLSEKLAESQSACVVKFRDSKNGQQLGMQTTTFEVVKSLPMRSTHKKSDVIQVPYGVTAETGDSFFLMGQLKNGELEWNLPIPLDELGTEYNYLVKAPDIERASAERLAYFLTYLDSRTPLISNDAFGEFARAKFEDVELLAPKFDREKIRKWLEDPNPQLDVRRAFYGMLLGLCGNHDDAAFLEQKILAPVDPEKNRLGIDGLMGGYLMLRGQAGLTMLMAKKVESVPVKIENDDSRIVDLNAVRISIGFLWDFRRQQFTEESLRAAMRRFLDRPEFAELVVVDLSRWKDWASLDRLIEAYGRDPWDTRSAQEKIVAFALSCQKDIGSPPSATRPAHAVKAQTFLDSLDPEFVRIVKRNYRGL